MNIEAFCRFFCSLNFVRVFKFVFTCQPLCSYIHYVIDAVSLNAILEQYTFRVTVLVTGLKLPTKTISTSESEDKVKC